MRLLLTAILLGTKMDLVIVDLLKGEHRSEAYLRINPNGKVPLLDDGGFQLWESHAIMQYLADQIGEPALYPKDVQSRADVNRWLFWSAYHFTPPPASSAENESQRKWSAGRVSPIRSKSHAERRCLPRRRGCSIRISPTNNGSAKDGSRSPI